MAGAHRSPTGGLIHLERAYDAPEAAGKPRFLVDRLWPRGLKKDALHLTGWLPQVAPSGALRRWFAHDPVLDAAIQGDITLIYAARDAERNNAVVLKAHLEERLAAAARQTHSCRPSD